MFITTIEKIKTFVIADPINRVKGKSKIKYKTFFSLNTKSEKFIWKFINLAYLTLLLITWN